LRGLPRGTRVSGGLQIPVASVSSSRLLKAGFKPAMSMGGRAVSYEAAHVAIDSEAGR
jgi:hypothetical protein